MRKSTVVLASGLWLLALINMWLVLQAGEEHAQAAQSRARNSPWPEPPQSTHSLVIVNAPPDTGFPTSGPSTRTTPRCERSTNPCPPARVRCSPLKLP
jgi:hypothetical protein